MKRKIRNNVFLLLVVTNVLLLIIQQLGCSSNKLVHNETVDTLNTNLQNEGLELEVVFKKGNKHNHPLMAMWISDTNDKYIETLYVAQSIAKGVFEHGDNSQGKWQPGPIRRPSALPVWSHSRGVLENDGLYIPTINTPMPDAVTGATPKGNFILKTRVSESVPTQFYIYFEINQTWDWNEYWTNNKYPDDDEYKTSCQPALIYKALIDINETGITHALKLIGHSHYNGSNGDIFPNIETITTARNITDLIVVRY